MSHITFIEFCERTWTIIFVYFFRDFTALSTRPGKVLRNVAFGVAQTVPVLLDFGGCSVILSRLYILKTVRTKTPQIYERRASEPDFDKSIQNTEVFIFTTLAVSTRRYENVLACQYYSVRNLIFRYRPRSDRQTILWCSDNYYCRASKKIYDSPLGATHVLRGKSLCLRWQMHCVQKTLKNKYRCSGSFVFRLDAIRGVGVVGGTKPLPKSEKFIS